MRACRLYTREDDIVLPRHTRHALVLCRGAERIEVELDRVRPSAGPLADRAHDMRLAALRHGASCPANRNRCIDATEATARDTE